MENTHKRNISSSYYDGNSFSSLASQTTLTDSPTQPENYHLSPPADTSIEILTIPPTPNTEKDAPLPFKASIWKANTIHGRPRANTTTTQSGIPRFASMKASNYHSYLEKRVSNHHTDLTRENSIATAISMRRADINVSRDNPQYFNNQQRMSGVRNDDEETTVITSTDLRRTLTHVEPEDELLFEKKKSVIILLGRLLLKCGCPCHRVDDTLQLTANLLMLDASFSFLPDSVLITFTNGDDSQSIMVKSPQGYDNGKLAKINDIMNDFFKGDIDLDRCLVLLHDVATAPPSCGMRSTVLFFVLSSFSASGMMFGGTWIDACVSAFLGFVVAILFLISCQFPVYARVFEVSTSIFVAIFTRALHKYCCFLSVSMPGLLILLPGYTMTVGVMELSSRQVTTGIIRVVYAVFYAFQLAYGLQIGGSVYKAIDPDASDEGLCGQNLVSPWFYFLLFPMLTISIALSYGSTRKQWISQSLSAGVAFCMSYFLGKVIPDGQIVGCIAAFGIGLYSNLASKLTGELPLASLSVGVTLLVPGSIGVKGAYAALHTSHLGQGNFPMQMLTIALGLSAGLFAASMIVFPSGKKRSMYISL